MKHQAPIQIRFADTDMLGHVNNANYLTYMELARMSYFNEVVNDAVDWSKEGVILAKATIDYRRPVYLEDSLVVYLAVDHISSKSFSFSYQFKVTKNGEETVCAEGSTIMVCFDYQLNKSIVMPSKWKERIMQYEGMEAQ
jgi:acyl-CoA thioester hydrolase